MRIFTKTILLILLLTIQYYAQINENLIIVKRIRTVSFTRAYDEAGKEFDKKTGVEIELFTAARNGFYLGMVNGDGKFIEHSPYCLQIGNLKAVVEGGSRGKPNPDNRTRFFVLSKEDWNKLKNGDEMRLFYGCPLPKEYKTLNPIGHLDKTVLNKTAPKQCTLPLEFAPKLQNLGLGFGVGRVYERAYFNERKDSETKILTLSYTGPENAEKLLPNYDREYLKQLKDSPSGFPGMISEIDNMTLSVFDDLIYKLELTYSEPLNSSTIRSYTEMFAEKWSLPMFWKYSKNMTKAELNCANFKIAVDSNKFKPRIILTNTKTEAKLKKVK